MVGQQLTPAQRAFLVLRYAETDHDLNRVRQEFLERFNRDPPSKQTILRNVAKYREHGTSKNLNQGRSGRPKTARSANNIQRVRESLTHNPRQSSRRNDLANITKSSFNRIARLDLKFHPYKIQRRHKLIPADYQRRVTFCRWLLARPERFLSMLVIGDEATFKMNGCVSTHTVRYYASKDNPPRDFVFDVPHNLQKITVWIGMIGNNTIIGPHFFRGNVNSGNYLAMLNDEVIPELLRMFGHGRNGSVRRVWWAQDGAPAHRSAAVRDRLQEVFPDRVIGMGHAVEWPPRSPDLTPCDFCLWGYLKQRVFLPGPPRTIAELEERIRVEVRSLRRTRIVRRGVHHMAVRAQRCIQLDGHQVEGRSARE